MNVSKKSDPAALQSSDENPSVKGEYADEISLVDILKFLRRRFKIIGAITFAITITGTGTGLITSPQARRELLLHLELPPEMALNLSMEQDEDLIQNEIFAAADLALKTEFIQFVNGPLRSSAIGVSLSSVTDENAERLQLTLTNVDTAALETANQPALETLQKAADEVAVSYIEPEIARLDLLIQRTQEKITFLEEQLAASALSTEADTAAFSSLAQLQQQIILAEEFGTLADYQLERADLSSLETSDEPIVNIQVLMDTQTQVSDSLLQRLLLSLIAGLILSILVALIIDQLPQLQAALSTPDN